jgi:cytosine/adenosine deaminase-related metal-dependent hydrolase
MDMIIRRTRISDEQPLMDIGIADGKITAIEQAIEQTADQEIDAEGRVALPGFVEPHLHLEKAFLHRRLPPRFGTLDEAIRLTGILKSKQEKQDVLDRSRQVLDMAVKSGTVVVRAHPDVDPIQGLIGVETALLLKDEYRDLLDLQIVAFPQEGWLKTSGVQELMEQALALGVAMPVVQNTCHYRKAVKFGFPLLLYTTHHIQSAYTGRLVFNHYLIHEKQKTAMAFGQSAVTLLDVRTNRLVKDWPEQIWQRYQALA